jgi:hypothetical protein
MPLGSSSEAPVTSPGPSDLKMPFASIPKSFGLVCCVWAALFEGVGHRSASWEHRSWRENLTAMLDQFANLIGQGGQSDSGSIGFAASQRIGEL